MAKRVLPKVKVYKRYQPRRVELPSPQKPNFAGEEGELLTGTVQGMKASAPEERFVKSLSKHPKVQGLQFRFTVGAPRGLPGWKEVDVLASAFGLIYAFEVDTEFTHRNKEEKDRLHDAIVLTELRKLGFNVYPQVIHVEGEKDLVDEKKSDSYVKRIFG